MQLVSLFALAEANQWEREEGEEKEEEEGR